MRINLEDEAEDDEENDFDEKTDLEENDLVEYDVFEPYSSSRCFLEELENMWFGRDGAEAWARGGNGRRSRRPRELTLKLKRGLRDMRRQNFCTSIHGDYLLGLRKQRPIPEGVTSGGLTKY